MCKKSYYGNCDPETSNNEYCIFHKPNKSEEEAKEFWRKIIKTFEPKIKTITYNKVAKVRCLAFEKRANFEGYVFPPVFKKYEDEWCYWGYFEYALFMDGASFKNCIFEGSISFMRAVFFGGATFRNARFKEDVDFSEAHFIGRTDFTRACFEAPAFFIGTKFVSFGSLNDIDLLKDYGSNVTVIFKNTEFRDRVTFHRASFEAPLLMTGACFHSPGEDFLEDIKAITFKYASNKVELCRALRKSCEKLHLSEEADRAFVCEMRALRRWRTQRKILMAKAIRQKISAAMMRLRYFRFIARPLLLSLLKGYVYLAYLMVKSWFIQATAYLVNIIEFLVADVTCEYGVNWIRPILIWLTTVLLFFPTLYTFVTLLGYRSISPTGSGLSNLLQTSIYFSVVTATGIGYGSVHPVGVGKIIASIEAIFSTFMWGIFLVVFVRKYMRD